MSLLDRGGHDGKPLEPVHGWCRWAQSPLLPCDGCPAGAPGLLFLNETPYLVTALADLPPEGPVTIRGWQLEKQDGTQYHIDARTWTCDCPDAAFRSDRPGGCKHASALRAALARIGIAVPAFRPVAPPTRSTADLARNHPDIYADEAAAADDAP